MATKEQLRNAVRAIREIQAATWARISNNPTPDQLAQTFEQWSNIVNAELAKIDPDE